MRSGLATLALLAVVVGFAVWGPGQVAGMVIGGRVSIKDNWSFIDKFVFDNDGDGEVLYYVQSDSDTLQLVVYDDANVNWPPNDTVSCYDFVDNANGVFDASINETGRMAFEDKTRPYYWFVSAADCTNDIDFVFNMTFLNPGSAWKKQFSFDKQGLLFCYLLYFAVYCLFAAIQLHAVLAHRKRGEKIHPVLQILTFGVVLELTAVVCTLMHYITYAGNGMGAPGLFALGEILSMASQLIILLLLVVLAQGWTITRPQLDHRPAILTGFALFAVAYLALFVWQHAGQDPMSTAYFYDSVPGVLVALLRMGLLAWFLFSLRSTIKATTERPKLLFYYKFGAIFTVYLLWLPFLMLLALMFASYLRYKIVVSLFLTVETIALAILAFLLHPKRGGDFFRMKVPTLMMGAETNTHFDEI